MPDREFELPPSLGHPASGIRHPASAVWHLLSQYMTKKIFFQRAFLAFTTGLFLACAARLSAGA
jgi:hypothetical protein